MGVRWFSDDFGLHITNTSWFEDNNATDAIYTTFFLGKLHALSVPC